MYTHIIIKNNNILLKSKKNADDSPGQGECFGR